MVSIVNYKIGFHKITYKNFRKLFKYKTFNFID